jgi:hypothetical protein
VQLRKEGECFSSIGHFLNKNHASIMHGVSGHDGRMQYDKEYKQLYTDFLNEIESPGSLEKVANNDLVLRADSITKELIASGLDAIEIMNFWEDRYDTEINKINQ